MTSDKLACRKLSLRLASTDPARRHRICASNAHHFSLVAGKALRNSTPLVLSQIYSRTLALLPATRVIDDTLGARLTPSLV